MKFGLIGVILFVAGCGADGAPLRPTASTSLSVGTNGTSVGTHVGLSNGNFSLGLGNRITR